MKNKIYYAYIFICAFFFSCMEVAIKSTNGAFNPIQVNLIRFFAGGIMLYPLAKSKLKKRNYKLTKKDCAKFALTGFLCCFVSMSFYVLCLSYIPAYQCAIIFACNTFFSIILARIFLNEHLTKLSSLALIIAFSGMLIIMDPFSLENSFFGVFICLLAAITFSIYSVTGKYFTHNKATEGTVITCYSFLFGSLFLLLFVLVSKIGFVSDFLIRHGLKVFSNIPIIYGITKENIFILLFICIGVTGIGFATYFLAIEHLGVTMASTVYLIKPVISPVIAYLMLGEIIPSKNILGIALITIGSIIIFVSNIFNTN